MQENEFQTLRDRLLPFCSTAFPKLLKWNLTRPTQTKGFEELFQQKKTKEAKHWPQELRNLRAARSPSLENLCSLRYLLFNPLLPAFTSIRYFWTPRPAYRILKKQNHLMISVRKRKKTDSSASSFALQGF